MPVAQAAQALWRVALQSRLLLLVQQPQVQLVLLQSQLQLVLLYSVLLLQLPQSLRRQLLLQLLRAHVLVRGVEGVEEVLPEPVEGVFALWWGQAVVVVD